MPEIRTPSTVDALADALRDRILDGGLPPGSRLNEVALAASYGVARHTLRAAIARLATESLVRVEPRRGAFVRVVTREELADLHHLRRAIELAALDLALVRGARFDAARAAADALAALGAEAAWAEVTRAHNAVHQALVDAAGSPRLSAASRAIEPELALLVRQIRPCYPPARMAELHLALVAEVASGSPGRARRALARDLDVGLETLLGALDAPA